MDNGFKIVKNRFKKTAKNFEEWRPLKFPGHHNFRWMRLAGEISRLLIPAMKTGFLTGADGGNNPCFFAVGLNQFSPTTTSELWSVGLTPGFICSPV
jgi:hypothetical protein